MIEKINITQWIIIAVSLVAAPFIGALISGLDRKVTARMQGRKGPPVIQPFYDIIKLFSKQPVALHKLQILYAFLHLVFMMLVVVLLAMGQDLLMILFAHAFSTICLVLGGMSVRSPYSRIGSMRKIMQMLAYEPILILIIVAIYLQTDSFLASSVMSMPKPMLWSMPLLFLAFLCAVAIKLNKSPFDVSTSHHAHQEIVKGITIEYAGPYLGIIEIAHLYETAILFFIIMMFWQTNYYVGFGLETVAFLAILVLDNTFSRLTTTWMLKYMWSIPLFLSIANIIWLWSK
ncbi:MAG: complex I subunit 1 family protein [Victivallaceae bacterium]|jgi:ech hydrogenase subunit B